MFSSYMHCLVRTGNLSLVLAAIARKKFKAWYGAGVLLGRIMEAGF